MTRKAAGLELARNRTWDHTARWIEERLDDVAHG